MDSFGDLFRGVRAQGSLFGSSTLTAPWSLLFVDGAPLTLCAVLDGGGWIVTPGRPAVRVRAGEMLVVKGPQPFSFVDEPGTTAAPLECGVACAVPELGGTVHRVGWHEAAPAPSGGTTLIVGAYPVHGEIGERLLDAVPPVVRVDAGGAAGAVLQLLAAEVAVDAPGQQVVLDRLLDWALVCALREWFERPGTDAPSWYTAHTDPVVGRVLKLVHTDPAAPWTVASLAERAGVSRATMAKRFTELVGKPPLAYLTCWRMTLAADLMIDDPTATIAQVASSVGYSDAFAFSAAFKRIRGVPPSRYRSSRRSPGAAAPTVPGSPRRLAVRA